VALFFPFFHADSVVGLLDSYQPDKEASGPKAKRRNNRLDMEKTLGKMEAETRNACHVLSMDGNA
jgi:hypothetical protein